MSIFSQSTHRRLCQLPLVDTVWEGDRLPMVPGSGRRLRAVGRQDSAPQDSAPQDSVPQDSVPQDYILWIDGIQGAVRAIDTVNPGVGQEALVRTLVRAMESPLETHQGAPSPCRPKKIVVRDRQLHFFLRGVLQQLDITVEYRPILPVADALVDHLVRYWETQTDSLGQAENRDKHPQRPHQPPSIARPLPLAPNLGQTLGLPGSQHLLYTKAQEVWEAAPWSLLADHQILALEFSALDWTPLYVSVLGQAAMEFGLLFYRSLDSLKQFRQQILNSHLTAQAAEEAFLQQDCLYLTYLMQDTKDKEPVSAGSWTLPSVLSPVTLTGQSAGQFIDQSTGQSAGQFIDQSAGQSAGQFIDQSAGQPIASPSQNPTGEPWRLDVGSIHPLEGMRTQLSGEDVTLLMVALEALLAFWQEHQGAIAAFPPLKAQIQIPPSPAFGSVGSVPQSVQISTLPQVAQELLHQEPQLDLFWKDPMALLRMRQVQNSLICDRAIVSIGVMPWSIYGVLQGMGVVQGEDLPESIATTGEGLPVIMVQTTAPKAKALMAAIAGSGGIEAIGFNPGYDFPSAMVCDIGLIKLQSGVFEVFGEYNQEGQIHRLARQKWDQRTQATGQRCGLVVAKGLTGKAKGQPGIREIVGFCTTRSVTSEEMGLGMLHLQFIPSSFS
ncbi:DUF6930 domain-containing protein [Prochlorothrix hollandica]|uniref:DUF6930 domain-containing protein n=1 Tax=Prochlorothrix hollandica TaxID=1223 RepID=UPI00333EB013